MTFSKDKYKRFLSRKLLLLYGSIVFLVYFIFCLPSPLFKSPTSTILLSKEGQLMNAKIADDGQWRFPIMDSLPDKFKSAIIAYEDRSFYKHPGISARGIGRAIASNFKAKKVVSGGSTITMQIARLSRRGSRNVWNKVTEAIWALRLETKYSKEELLKLYASNAPFGGNVVGLEAAAWRYYGQSPFDLSWAEVATLAVLPNSPSMVHPGKNRTILLNKRNRVLKTLLELGKIDEVTYELSLDEPLIDAPKRLPSLAPHVLNRAVKKGKKGQRIQTTLNYQKQKKFTETLERYQANLSQNYIHNASLLIIDVRTNEIVTYIGNSSKEVEHQMYVDLIQAPRSSGSILKPFLYAAMTQEGALHNHQLIPDIPLHFDHFSPKNYDNKFEGAVRAGDALARSLNIPAVYLLKQYGIDKFLHKLQDLGQKTITKDADYYGLSLILGGAESTLWDVANGYAAMTKTLNFYNKENKYNQHNWDEASLFEHYQLPDAQLTQSSSKLDAAAIYEVFESLLSVNRPLMDASWQQYSSSQKIAWKTGTSFGNRDAWAVGATPNYVVAVLVGNATGEGRPAIIGTTAAAPIMFNIFSNLESSKRWFVKPYDELVKVEICKESGYISTPNCTQTEIVELHKNALQGTSCHFHKTILTDLAETYRFHQECTDGEVTKSVSRFLLPPLQAYFYKMTHPNYKDLPPYHPNCKDGTQEQTFSVIYPQNNSRLVGTIDLKGTPQPIIFEASHTDRNAKLFWHIDNQYLGETQGNHRLRYTSEIGEHWLTVIDEKGNQRKIKFTVLSK